MIGIVLLLYMGLGAIPGYFLGHPYLGAGIGASFIIWGAPVCWLWEKYCAGKISKAIDWWWKYWGHHVDM